MRRADAPPIGACLLRLDQPARLVDDPFGPNATLDETALGELTRTAVRLLDNVIDISRYPCGSRRRKRRPSGGSVLA